MRVGRPALDEDAIRTIEDQHPDIEFDWPHILEVRAAAIVEVERRPERGSRGRGGDAERRRASRPREEAPASAAPQMAASGSDVDASPDEQDERGGESPTNSVLDALSDDEPIAPQPAHVPDLLAELVGRDIATRLRARYAEINARIHQLPVDDATRAAWHTRAERLNPDSWLTPDEILHGVSRADEFFDALRHELLS